jgi:hypothetical protein
VQRRVGQEVAAYLLRRGELGLEDEGEGVALLVAKVKRSGNLESMPDLPLEGHGGHLNALAEICGELEVTQFGSYGDLVDRNVGRFKCSPEVVAVVAAAVTEVHGKVVFGTPKSHQRRSVPVPRFLAEELAVHLAGKGPGRSGIHDAGRRGVEEHELSAAGFRPGG